MKSKTKVSQRNKTILVFIVLSFLVCSLVFADGASRQPTQPEKDFNKFILNTFAKAVPPGPAGWEKTPSSTEIGELQVVYSGEKDPLQVEYRIDWEDTKRIQEAQIKLQEELIKLAQKPGFTGEGVDELQKKMEPRDVRVRIDFCANMSSVSIYDKIAPAPAIAGGLVYRSQGAYRNGWSEGSTYIFLGKNWKATIGADGSYVTHTPDKSITSSTVVQNIYVRVQADSKRADRIIQKIDWEALKKLIKN